MTMIERVAEALANAGGSAEWGRETASGRNWWRRQARVAIEAMKEPTPEMLAVGEISESNLHLIWTRMIEEALK